MQRNVLIVLLVCLGLLCCLGPALAQGPPVYPNRIYFTDFSTDLGWTSSGGWEWGTSDTCCGGQPYSAGGMYGYMLDEDAAYGQNVSDTLTTTTFDLTGKHGVHMSVWMNWGLGYGDGVTLEASSDGETWIPVWAESGNSCSGWERYTIDVSSVVDDQPAASFRWTLASDGNGNCRQGGLDLDDLMLFEETTERPFRVLMATPYSDDPVAAANLQSLLWERMPGVWVEYWTDNCCDLFDEVAEGDWDAFIVGTPDWNSGGGGEGAPPAAAPPTGVEDPDMVCCGEEFADSLRAFLARGGTVISCGETVGASGFMRGSGLLDIGWASSYLDGYGLTSVAGNPFAEDLTSPLVTNYLTSSYALGPAGKPALTDPLGNAAVAYRDHGVGGAVSIGYSYDSYDDNAAQVLINALQYSQSLRASRNVLVYDTSNTHTATAALDQLHLPYTTAGAEDFDSQLASKSWDMVLVDNPANGEQDWTGLLGYVENGGKVAFSSTGLDLQPVLRAEFGVSAAEVADVIPPVHWTAEGLSYLSSIPELLNWNDTWTASGYRLWASDAADFVLAQYDAIPESQCQDALVSAHGGRTLLNGFLWDERNQDSDSDGIDDTVELVMVEIQHFLGTPKADFVAVPKAGSVPLEVSFTDTSTNFPYTWGWDFGDGSYSCEANPVHIYEAPGVYTVTHCVWNENGSDRIVKMSYVELASAAPEADFSATPTSGLAPLTVSFSDLSTNAPSAWAWNFGDGTTSEAQNPSHEYTAPGTYTVSLTASNAAGTDTEEKAAYVTVLPPAPGASFSANVTSGNAPLVVEFSDESTNDPTSWSWDFGDGTTSDRQNPIHVYGSVGYYTVSLTANGAGGTDTMERPSYIVVSFADAPSDNWAYDAIMACVQGGIVQGYGYEYRPDTTVKRDQIAVFFARALAGGEANVPTGPAVATFADVPTSHWAFRHVEYLQDYDVVRGYWDGYHPGELVNRAQMAVFAARADAGGESSLSDWTAPTTSPFSDVATDFWAYKHIAYCQSQDIVNGYADGTYVPGRLVTRDQMAMYIARTFHLLPE